MMEHIERITLRHLQHQVEEETDTARLKFPANKAIETLPLAYGQVALVEEIGKLSRCLNKLVIAKEASVVSQWWLESEHRIVTSLSILERIYMVIRRGNAKV